MKKGIPTSQQEGEKENRARRKSHERERERKTRQIRTRLTWRGAIVLLICLLIQYPFYGLMYGAQMPFLTMAPKHHPA